MRIAAVVVTVLSSFGFRAGAQPLDAGARLAALGGAGTALDGEVWGASNPAAWATLSGGAAAVSTGRRFGLRELDVSALAIALPTRLGAFAALARTFGFERFRESAFGAGYARAFSPGSSRPFFAGAALRVHTVGIPGYGSASAVGLSLGWLVGIGPALAVGFQAVNLNRPRYAPDEPLPRTLSLGLLLRPGPGSLFLLDACKDVRFPLHLRAGAELRPAPGLVLRTGLGVQRAEDPAAAPLTRFTAGAGLRTGALSVDLAAERHPFLGWSPSLSAGLSW